MCPLKWLHFLTGTTPRLPSPIRGHLAPDFTESGPAGDSRGSPPSPSQEVRGRGTPEPAPPNHPRLQRLSLSPSPTAFARPEERPSGTRRERRHPTRSDREPGVPPASPSPRWGARVSSYLLGPRRSRAQRVSGAPAAGDPGSQKHWIPQAPPELQSPGPSRAAGTRSARRAGSAQRPRSPGRRGWRVPLAAPGSRVGSEPVKAENVPGRDRAQTHSSLSTEPPTYFNPPPSLLLPPSSLPCPPTLPRACALGNKVLLTRAAVFGSCAR